MEITKKQIDVYKIRGKVDRGYNTWGDISAEFGEQSVHIMANSDFGTYSYYWNSTGEDPKKFLCDLNMDYAMKKLSGYDLYEPDTDKYEKSLLNRIKEVRKDGGLTKEEARRAFKDMRSIIDQFSNSGDLMYEYLWTHELSNKVFSDHEDLPSGTRIKYDCEAFWKYIWIPFTEELKREMSLEKETV